MCSQPCRTQPAPRSVHQPRRALCRYCSGPRAMATIGRAPAAVSHARSVHSVLAGAVGPCASRARSSTCNLQLRPANPLISLVQSAASRRHATAARSAVRVQAAGSGLKIDLTGEVLPSGDPDDVARATEAPSTLLLMPGPHAHSVLRSRAAWLSCQHCADARRTAQQGCV